MRRIIVLCGVLVAMACGEQNTQRATSQDKFDVDREVCLANGDGVSDARVMTWAKTVDEVLEAVSVQVVSISVDVCKVYNVRTALLFQDTQTVMVYLLDRANAVQTKAILYQDKMQWRGAVLASSFEMRLDDMDAEFVRLELDEQQIYGTLVPETPLLLSLSDGGLYAYYDTGNGGFGPTYETYVDYDLKDGQPTIAKLSAQEDWARYRPHLLGALLWFEPNVWAALGQQTDRALCQLSIPCMAPAEPSSREFWQKLAPQCEVMSGYMCAP